MDNIITETPDPAKGHFLIYQAEDGQLKLDVRFEDESVWLSQKLMAELFQKDVRTINEHIQNVYDEGELEYEKFHRLRIQQTDQQPSDFEQAVKHLQQELKDK